MPRNQTKLLVTSVPGLILPHWEKMFGNNREHSDQLNREQSDQLNREQSDQLNREQSDQLNREQSDQLNSEQSDQVNEKAVSTTLKRLFLTEVASRFELLYKVLQTSA